MLDYIVDKMGIPRSVVNNEETREAIIEQMQQQMTQMQGQQASE
jgi:hypothetical protein